MKQADNAWNPQLSARLLPSGAIEEEDSVTALRHLAADLFKMVVHRLGVGARQQQGRAGIAARAASAGYAGPLAALIARPGRTAAALCPNAGQCVKVWI